MYYFTLLSVEFYSVISVLFSEIRHGLVKAEHIHSTEMIIEEITYSYECL